MAIKISSLLFILFLPLSSYATNQGGLGMEISVGYPTLSIATGNQQAKYSGVSAQANLLLPLMSAGLFSMDLDLFYRYSGFENNASTSTQAEWAIMHGFGSGVRFNFSYLFAGVDHIFMTGKHLKAGTVNETNNYDFTPLQWHAGINLPLSPVTSVAVGYSQLLNGNAKTQGQNIEVNEQILWFRIQIDFGIGFFNLLSPGESFEATRSDFFVQ